MNIYFLLQLQKNNQRQDKMDSMIMKQWTVNRLWCLESSYASLRNELILERENNVDKAISMGARP